MVGICRMQKVKSVLNLSNKIQNKFYYLLQQRKYVNTLIINAKLVYCLLIHHLKLQLIQKYTVKKQLIFTNLNRPKIIVLLVKMVS
jgi:hypothetical protein